MPFFAYKGRDSKGVLVQGVLEGADTNALANQLLNLNITPIDIQSRSNPTRSKGTSINLFEEKK